MTPAAPYRGLVPYAEEDALLFFGREREREIIAANLLSARLTVLYGSSGVGKSSVLRAGVAHQLRRLARIDAGGPRVTIAVFSDWRGDPVEGIRRALAQAVGAAEAAGDALASCPSSLTALLHAAAAASDSHVLLILDQFEEYFLYHADGGDRTGLEAEFPRALTARDLPANLLVSIREDALARLDRFKGRVPSLFDNLLRLEHLSRDAARAAIEGPLEQYNRMVPPQSHVRIEAALVQNVLDQLESADMRSGLGGRSPAAVGQDTPRAATRIEAPYLQLVMTRLWRAARDAGSGVLRADTLERLGGAATIAETHLDDTLAGLTERQRDVAAGVFHFLVTPSGAKIAHSAADLATYANLPVDEISDVLTRLSASDVRILRPVASSNVRPHEPLRYEIFHDVLAPAIADWRTRHVQRARQAALQAQLRRRHRRILLAAAGVAVVVVGSAIMLVFDARRQQHEAAARAAAEVQEAAARELMRAAETAEQPEVRTALALHALSSSPLPSDLALDAENALQRAVQSWTNQFFTPADAMSFREDAVELVTANADGTITVWRGVTNDMRTLLSDGRVDQPAKPQAEPQSVALPVASGEQILAAGLSPDGRLLALADTSGHVTVWDLERRERLYERMVDKQGVTGLQFIADARVKVRVWSGEWQIWHLTPGVLEPAMVDATSRDGSRLASLDRDGMIRVRATATGQQVASGPGPDPRTVIGLRFAPNGDKLVMVLCSQLQPLDESSEGCVKPDEIRVWEVASEVLRMVSRWRAIDGLEDFAVDESGTLMVAATNTQEIGTIRPYVLDRGKLLTFACRNQSTGSLEPRDCHTYFGQDECPVPPICAGGDHGNVR